MPAAAPGTYNPRTMARRRLSHRVGPFLARLLGPSAVRALGATWRIRLEPADLVERSRRPGVYAVWHGRMLVPAYALRGCGVSVMISLHADGEVIARIVERLGFRTVRGSTTRGGPAALRDAVDVLRAGGAAAFTPDGPKGPREVAQPGVVYAASRSGLPVFPVGVGARSAWTLGSWDRFRIPRPFTRVALVLGEPMTFPPDLEGEALDAACRRLEASLRAADDAAGRLAGAPAP